MSAETKRDSIDRSKTDLVPFKAAGQRVQIVPNTMGEAMECAKMIAGAGNAVPAHVRQSPGIALDIALKAWSAGLHPYDLARQTYVVRSQGGQETVAYMAQAIHAIVMRSGLIEGRMEFEYKGEGANRKCTATAKIGGAMLHYDSPPIGQIKVKNSPLWQSDPDQQLAYFCARNWTRKFAPDALMGLYTPDEIESGQMIDVTPASEPDSTAAIAAHLNVSSGPPEETASGTVDGRQSPVDSPEAPHENPTSETAAHGGEATASVGSGDEIPDPEKDPEAYKIWFCNKVSESSVHEIRRLQQSETLQLARLPQGHLQDCEDHALFALRVKEDG